MGYLIFLAIFITIAILVLHGLDKAYKPNIITFTDKTTKQEVFACRETTFEGLGYRRREELESKYNKSITQHEGKTILSKVKFAPLLLLPTILFTCVSSIGANQVGIKFDPFNGGIQENTLGEGMNFKAPWEKVQTISTALQTAEFELAAQTGGGEKGGQFVTYSITVNYNIDKSEAGKFYKQHGTTQLPYNVLVGATQSALQAASEQHTVYEIMGGARGTVESKTAINLIPALRSLNVNLVGVQIRDVDAGYEIEKIIKDKAAAEAAVEIAINKAKADYEAEQGRIKIEQAKIAHELEMKLKQAENDKEVAEIEAEIAAVKAAADAEVERIKTEMEAQMKALMAETTAIAYGFATKDAQGNLVFRQGGEAAFAQIVAYFEYLKAWDGQLPQIILDSTGGISVILPPVIN